LLSEDIRQKAPTSVAGSWSRKSRPQVFRLSC